MIKQKLETEEKYLKIKKLEGDNNKSTNSTFDKVNKTSGNYNLSIYLTSNNNHKNIFNRAGWLYNYSYT